MPARHDLKQLLSEAAGPMLDPAPALAQLLRRRRHRRGMVSGVAAASLLVVGVIAVLIRSDDGTTDVVSDRGEVVKGSSWEDLADAPIDGRIGAGVVWTGREMIVWGGLARSPVHEASDGAAYDPATNSWRAIAPAPSGVFGVVGTAAAWTGDRAVFWAGNSPDGPAAGAIYDPEADTWQRVAEGPLGPREGYSTVWTGTELLIIAGTSGDQGARPVAAALNPSENTWRLLSALNDLPGLAPLGAVWDGEQVFIAGSLYLCPELGSVCTETRPIFLAYDPQTDSSHEIDLTNAPADVQAAPLAPLAWTGTDVVFTISGEPSAGVIRYDPSDETWSTGEPGPCPVGDPYYSQSAWLGDRYVVSCGLDALQIYDASTDTWEAVSAGPSPLNVRAGSAIVWTGTDLIAWSGTERRPGNPTPNDGSLVRLG